MKRGWVTHLATNGAGVIHDWEFAYIGKSSEDVRANVEVGKFGTWQETGYYINLALAVGSYRNLGYGESIGHFIENNGLEIPSKGELLSLISQPLDSNNSYDEYSRVSAAVDLLELINRFSLPEGFFTRLSQIWPI